MVSKEDDKEIEEMELKPDSKKDSVEGRVMPAQVEETSHYYSVSFNDGGMYLQRKEEVQATDSPLSLKEIVIMKLCETILGKQA